MRKWLLTVLAAITLLILGLVEATAAQNMRILVNGREIISDVPPQVVNGRTLVPLRVIGEALGANVSWDEGSNTVIVTTSEDSADVKRFLSKSQTMRQFLLTLADYIEADSTIIPIIQEAVEKHLKSRQSGQLPQTREPEQFVPYIPETNFTGFSSSDHYSQKVRDEANAQRAKIRAAAEAQRDEVRRSAEAARASLRAQIETTKAQIESYYQAQKMALDREKRELIRQWDEYFNSRGLLQSGIRNQKIQEIETYYEYQYRALEEQQRARLEQLYNAMVEIDRSEQEALRRVDAWEREQLQRIDQWESEILRQLVR
ncbi:MAG: stalk domain-containing protein [Moorella sp. (in: firmicutes)]